MIYLQEATLKDRKKAYQWLYLSDYSSIQDITGTDNIPSFEEFEKDYEDYYFGASHPEKGRAYLIILKNGSPEEIGFISYTAFHLRDGAAELDIWLKGSKFIDKGYGTSALKSLSLKLFNEGFHTLIIRPSLKNI